MYSSTGGPDRTRIGLLPTDRTAFTHRVSGSLYLGQFCCGTPVHCRLTWLDTRDLRSEQLHDEEDCNLGFGFVSDNPHALWVVSSRWGFGPIYLSLNDGADPLALLDIEIGEAPRSVAFDAATNTPFLTVENWQTDRCELWTTQDMGETWAVSDAPTGGQLFFDAAGDVLYMQTQMNIYALRDAATTAVEPGGRLAVTLAELKTTR